MKRRYQVRNKLEPFYSGGPIKWHPDGTQFACACSQEIKLVRGVDGCIVKTFPGDEELITALDFSPDGKLLFSASRSLLVKKWCVESGHCLHTLKPHLAPVSDINVDPSGSVVAFSSADKTITIHDIQGNYRTHTFKSHTAVVLQVLFHPSEAELLSCSQDNTIRVWDLRNSKLKRTLKGHTSAVTCVAYSEDGRFFVSSGRDNVVNVWSAIDYSKCVEFPVFEAIEDICCLSNSVARHFLKTKKRKAKNPLLIIATGGAQGRMRVWRSDNGSCVFGSTSQTGSHLSEIVSTQLLPSHQQLIVARYDCSLEFLSINAHDEAFELETVRHLMGNMDEITAIKFLRGMKEPCFAVATNSPNIQIFKMDNLNCQQVLMGHSEAVLCLSSLLLEERALLISGSKDRSVRIWDVISNSCLCDFVGHGAAVTALAMSKKTNNLMITVSADKLVKTWKIKNRGEKVKAMSGIVAHAKDINCVDIAYNDNMIATGSMDRTVKVFALQSFVLQMTFSGHTRGIWSVRFSRVEKTLLSSSADLTIKMWSVSDGACLRTFEGHYGSVMEAHFLSNSTQILSCGGDGLIKLWTVNNCENTNTFDEHEDRVWTIAFEDEQQNLMVTGGSDSRLIVWDDATEMDKEAEIKLKQEELMAQQNLTNAIQSKEYGLAAQLAFTLDRPRQLLHLLKSNLAKEEYTLMFQAIVDHLRDDSTIRKSLEYIRDWNTNAKHCEEAQTLLNLILESISPHRIAQISGIDPVLEAIECYTQRHATRLQKLHQSSYLVDYTLECLNVLTND